MNELFFKLLDEIDPNKLNMVYSSPNGMTVLKSSEYDFTLEQVDELKRENIKLQERLNKAIEYIKERANIDDGYIKELWLIDNEINDLLEILKGGSDEI